MLGRPIRPGVALVMPILETLGVVVVLAFKPLGVGPRASNCFAVMPRYLLARDPSVIFAAARAAFDVFATLLFVANTRLASGVAFGSSLDLGRVVVDLEPKLGVAAPRRVRSEAGVMRPDAE